MIPPVTPAQAMLTDHMPKGIYATLAVKELAMSTIQDIKTFDSANLTILFNDFGSLDFKVLILSDSCPGTIKADHHPLRILSMCVWSCG